MTCQTKNDLKKIQGAIRMLARDDRKTLLSTKIGDNPAALDATLTLIEDLVAVIREQEGLYREEAVNPFTGEIVRIQCAE
jgi:hypothetical protein